MDKIEITLHYERTTKNKYLFKEDDVYDVEAVQSLYVNKKFFNGQNPSGIKLKLVLEEVED